MFSESEAREHYRLWNQIVAEIHLKTDRKFNYFLILLHLFNKLIYK